MTIKTKFDLGDKVWGIVYCTLGDPPPGWTLAGAGQSFLIDAILISRQRTEYSLESSSLPWFEEQLFPAASEAQAECDQQNKKAAE